MTDHSSTTMMRKIVIAGTFAQYMDWLALMKANRLAAPFVSTPRQLRDYEPDEDEIVLVGTYHDNDAYMSPEYLQFVQKAKPVQIAI